MSLAGKQLSVPTDKGANAGLKLVSLVAGMLAGADSIDGSAMLRHGAMKKMFTACYTRSTLGSFLCSFTFGHVRQFDTVASRFPLDLNRKAPLLGDVATDQYVYLAADNTILVVHGYK
ncbi:hypothetical protein GCM10025778_16220 [Paeniglutamicibacter antarcticus]|uniref:Uncharacterized protein n=1 Tax=Paeniglutamicibacter antarcticus TaxID=494023 RepID=A0ABP9TJU4_9MICC